MLANRDLGGYLGPDRNSQQKDKRMLVCVFLNTLVHRTAGQRDWRRVGAEIFS